MRVLMVCTDAEIGGAERLLVSLAKAKRDEDTVGLVVLMQPGSLSEQLEGAFDEVHYLNFLPSSRNLVGMVRGLEKQISRFTPDVISSHLFHADLVTALARTRVPKTTTVHTQGLSKADHPLTRAIAAAVGLLSFRFSAVIPAGDSKQMAAFIRSLRMKNVVAPIRNAATLPETRAFDPSSRTFLSLARNHPVKGHQQLFTAFAAIADDYPEWKLVAHGTGVTSDDPAMKTALRIANATELVTSKRILLAGATDSPEDALKDSSALVISSVYGEAFPIVGIEAASFGVPVISTNLGSCAEFVDDGRFLVEPNDPTGLAEAMSLYASLTAEERIDLSRSAFDRAHTDYHPRTAYESYRSVFTRAIDAKNK